MADTPSDEQDRRRRRLKEIEPDKVDLVDRAANQRRFLVFKEEAMPNEPEITPTEGVIRQAPSDGTPLPSDGYGRDART